ncbi:MAG: 4-(cytidine 5'-diphospho)-2-C-methyl-D-erythritol kinase [Acidobacteriota bacterium]
MPTVFPSFAKINLSLEVIGRRPDGYHELRTVFQTIHLYDLLEIDITDEPSITMTCDEPTLACDERNLVVRAAQELQIATGVRQGARLHLRKRIPMQAGLGGGSSNAAVTLLALQQLWGVSLPAADCQRLAAALGADVPFFLTGGTALGLGRGDAITPLPEVNLPFIVVVNPGLTIPTRMVFQRLNVGLTDMETVRKLTACLPSQIDWLATGNDLEATVFEAFPLVREVRDRLSAFGAEVARMSGSGSTVFGIFEEAQAGEAARQACLEAGWQAWWVSSVSREGYAACLKGTVG